MILNSNKRIVPAVIKLVILGFLFNLPLIESTNSYFTSQTSIQSNEISTGNWEDECDKSHIDHKEESDNEKGEDEKPERDGQDHDSGDKEESSKKEDTKPDLEYTPSASASAAPSIY